MKGVVQVVVHHAKPDKLRVPSRFHQPDGIRRGTGCAHRLHRTGRRGGRAPFARRSGSPGGRFVTNAALLVVAAIVLGVSPITVSWPIALTEAVVLTFGLVAMLVANALLLRPAFQPLERLARRMGDVDLLRPGQRFAVAARGEILALVAAFNQMLERLEAERRESGRRAVAAQEAERKRVASELHDEVGQAMTGC